MEKKEVTESNYESVLEVGDVSANPIEDLKHITEHVLTNVLSNKDNFVTCAEEILVDVQDNLNDLMGEINTIAGLVKNHHTLTLPFEFIYLLSDGKNVDEVLKHRIEHKILTWFKNLNTMMAYKVQVMLDKNPAALPSEFLLYWKNREAYFTNLYTQIDKKIGYFLTITNSPYTTIYKQMVDTIVSGM
ncbi:uncharacterized protein LOC126897980 [Daktulosphaira vitifoliae]|uniref:uncharacterized protein LOC126897980 n=1 Tax=Daktulosphaira vitifoliae TaxID=58002 RepID=UPI0021A9DBF6|nr:uncharacterized protein LOC126897980 [Daktulosphaira vitifoliae]